MMPVTAPPSRAPIAIAGEIHRQILIRGVPGDEGMSRYRRSPACLRGAQQDWNYKCVWLMAWQISCLAAHYHAWPQRLLRAIADAATQTWHAHGDASLRGRESDRLGLRLTARPDGAKHHPETGWAPIDRSENSNKSRYYRFSKIYNCATESTN